MVDDDCVSCGLVLCAIVPATHWVHSVRSVLAMLVVIGASCLWWWLWLLLEKFWLCHSHWHSQLSVFQCGQMCGVPDQDGQYFKVPGRCKILIGSNEGPCSHKQWYEGQQCCRESRHATGRWHLGLGIWTLTNGCKCTSAKRRSEMDQKPKDQERGVGIGSDDISGRLLKAEQHQTERWRHWSMTSRNTDLAAVGMQMALGIVRQMCMRSLEQRTRCVGGVGAKGGVGRGSQSWLGSECEGLGWLRQ